MRPELITGLPTAQDPEVGSLRIHEPEGAAQPRALEDSRASEEEGTRKL